jgi:hypothetical protein
MYQGKRFLALIVQSAEKSHSFDPDKGGSQTAAPFGLFYTIFASFLHRAFTSLWYSVCKSNRGGIEMNKAKLNYLLDVVIGLAFLLSGATGVVFMLMGSGGYQGGRNPGFATALFGINRATWSDLHTWISMVMIAGVIVHLALHWKWIVCLTRKMLPSLSRPTQEQVCEVVV